MGSSTDHVFIGSFLFHQTTSKTHQHQHAVNPRIESPIWKSVLTIHEDLFCFTFSASQTPDSLLTSRWFLLPKTPKFSRETGPLPFPLAPLNFPLAIASPFVQAQPPQPPPSSQLGSPQLFSASLLVKQRILGTIMAGVVPEDLREKTAKSRGEAWFSLHWKLWPFAVPCLASNEWAAGWQSETNSRDAENFL